MLMKHKLDNFKTNLNKIRREGDDGECEYFIFTNVINAYCFGIFMLFIRRGTRQWCLAIAHMQYGRIMW